MITSASDYIFVDFAQGDMPHANFDGDIMPVRQGSLQNILKAEDIAFLAEAAKERLYIWNDAQYMTSGYTVDPARLDTISDPETLAVPTWRFLNEQVWKVCYDLRDANWDTYHAQRHFGYLKTPFEEHIDSSISLSDAQEQWVDSHFVDYHDIVDYQTIHHDLAKSPLLELFENVRSMTKPVFSSYFNNIGWSMADVSTNYLTYTPTSWTDTSISVSQPYWYAERNPYRDHENEFRYIYPQTQGVFYYPRGPAARNLVDMTNGQLWYFLGFISNRNGFAMIQMPCTIVTGGRTFYVRVESSTFLQQFIRVGKSLGLISSDNTLAQGVNNIYINMQNAFFVANLTDHTKWWS